MTSPHRRPGLAWLGAVALVAAGCSGSDSGDPTATPPAPSAEATTTIAPSPPSTAAAPATTPPEPPPSTIDEPAPSETDPVAAFREAHSVVNEWRANPDDPTFVDRVRPLVTERFLADESFEITNVPEAAVPADGLVVFGPAETDAAGTSATLWFCQHLEPSAASDEAVSAVLRADMEQVEDAWRWAAEAELARSVDDGGGCPESDPGGVPVDDQTAARVVEALDTYFAARRAALGDVADADLVNAFLALTEEVPNDEDSSLVAETIDLDLTVIVDDAVPAVATFLGRPLALDDGRVIGVVCEPRNAKVVRAGADPDEQDFVRRDIVRLLSFAESDAGWVIDERTLIAESTGGGTCTAP